MDKIAEAIKDALMKTQEEHKIYDEEEATQLAIVVSTVAKSSKDIRIVFYSGVKSIAEKVQDILKGKEKELLKQINGKDDDDILN